MAFGLGVLGGVIGGLSLLSFAGIFAVALIALLGGVALHPKPFGAAGVLLGWAMTWIIVLAGAQARCDVPTCAAPDLTPWITISAGLATIGIVLLQFGITRPGWATRVGAMFASGGRQAAIRVGAAVILGIVTGILAATQTLYGWAITMAIALWVIWRNRSRDRRAAIAWFALAAVSTTTAIVTR